MLPSIPEKKYVQAPLWFDNILLSTTKFERENILGF
jgi:hypothetical protein